MGRAIVAKNLTFSYPQHALFEKASFTIDRGEYIGIIGPNGGGKTTLLKLLMGFLKPQGGTLTIESNLPDPSTHHLAYVPQSWRVDTNFPISVLELVLMGKLNQLPWYGRYSSSDTDAAIEALEQVGIASLASRPLNTLSGGQVQRALLARALVSKPHYLFLDEPTANIDAEAEEAIYQLLKALRGALTILMVTHNLQTAIHQVDRVLCVQNGIASFSPRAICEHFAMGLYHPPLLNKEETQ